MMQPYPGCTRCNILMHPLLISITFSAGGGAICDAPNAGRGAIVDAPKSGRGAILLPPNQEWCIFRCPQNQKWCNFRCPQNQKGCNFWCHFFKDSLLYCIFLSTRISPNFIKNQMKNKKVLLISRFSVQNFKVSVESWKSYIVQYPITNIYYQESSWILGSHTPFWHLIISFHPMPI